MKSGHIQILDLDFEYKFWKNKLYFYQSEIEIIKGRIQVLSLEVNNFDPGEENLKVLEMQQNTIKSQLNKINTLEEEMALYAEDYPIDNKHSHYLAHVKVKDDIEKISNRQDEILSNLLPVLIQP